MQNGIKYFRFISSHTKISEVCMKKFIVASMITMFVVCAAVSVNANTVREDCGCGLGAVLIGEKQGLRNLS
jgi:hypothetical protein